MMEPYRFVMLFVPLRVRRGCLPIYVSITKYLYIYSDRYIKRQADFLQFSIEKSLMDFTAG